MTSTIDKGTGQQPSRGSRRKWFGFAIAGLIVAALAIGLIYFFGGTEPAEVDLDATVNAVTQSTGSGSTGSNASPTTVAPSTGSASPVSEDVSGTWTVDATVGTLNFEEATASFAGFRVEEELARIGATTAVGRTADVTGTVTIDGTTITAAQIDVDLTTIVSNESRRDDKIQEALNTGQYPTAAFALTAPLDFGEVPAEGTSVAAIATGDLTINGVTRSIQIPLEAQVAEEKILVVGSAEIVFSDYDVETPSAQVVLSVADEGIIELQLWLVRA